MNKNVVILEKEEYYKMFDRIVSEIKTQRKYNNDTDIYVKLDDVLDEISRRLGGEFKVKGIDC